MVEGWQGRSRYLATWAAILVVEAFASPTIGKFSRGFPSPRVFGGVMGQATWVFEHLAIAFAVVGVIELATFLQSRRAKPAGDRRFSRVQTALRIIAVGATLVVGYRVATAAWVVTRGTEDRPFVTELARFAALERLPENAVFLFDGGGKGDHQTAMFLLDRTCYLLNGRPVDGIARQIREAGGIPYLVTANPPDPTWTRRFTGTNDPRSLYEWKTRK
jgi:hypothetical protein